MFTMQGKKYKRISPTPSHRLKIKLHVLNISWKQVWKNKDFVYYIIKTRFKNIFLGKSQLQKWKLFKKTGKCQTLIFLSRNTHTSIKKQKPFGVTEKQ